MAISVTQLELMSTEDIKVLEVHYRQLRREFPKQASSRGILLASNIKRCDDALRTIRFVLRQRTSTD